MSYPFNFTLPHRAKLVVIVLSIFLISLSVGLLVFGNNIGPAETLTAEVLHQGAEEVHHITP